PSSGKFCVKRASARTDIQAGSFSLPSILGGSVVREADHRLSRSSGVRRCASACPAANRTAVKRRARDMQHYNVAAPAFVSKNLRKVTSGEAERDGARYLAALEAGEGQRREEDGEEDVEHALLRVLRADLDDALGVGDRGLLGAVQADVGFDELDRAVGARRYRLRGGAGEPVDDGAAGDEAEQE